MVTKIYKGDSTNANGRTIQINLPDQDFDGLSIVFEFLGKKFIEESPERGGSIRCDFTAEETARMPLGTHFARLGIVRNGIEYTASATIPICVSDSVGDVYGGDASSIHLEMQFCGGIPDLTEVNDSPATVNELARAFKALLDALKGAQRSLGMLALAFCMSAFGASARLTVQSAPLGEVAFSSRVVTGVDFDESGLVTSDEIADVVREGQLKSMAWTNDNFKAAVEAVSPRVELPQNIVNSVNGQTGSVVFTGSDIATSAENERTVADSLAAKADEFTPWEFSGEVESLHSYAVEERPIDETYCEFILRKDGNWFDSLDGQRRDSLTLYFDDFAHITATRKRVLRTGDADKLTPDQEAVLAGGPYVPSHAPDGGSGSLYWSDGELRLDDDSLNVANTVIASRGDFEDLFIRGKSGATEEFVIAASNNLARVRLDIVLKTDPTQHYEIQRDGVVQTFDQVAALASDRDCYIKRANGIYHPTYVSAAEVMFDCVGTIQGLIETRRIHMLASTGAVTIGDLKVIADRDWVESLPTTYTNFSGTAFVALNQSVQTITTHGEQITITMPNAVAGGTRDFCVYINNEGSTESPLWLPSGTYYGDEDCTNAVKSGMVTALYFTEMSVGKFMLGRRELAQISVRH